MAAAGQPGAGHFGLDLGAGPAALEGSSRDEARGQFGLLAPSTTPGGVEQHGGRTAAAAALVTGERVKGKLPGKIVVDPPDLQAWREKLFNVDETIVLTHQEFETYFPHVDNVYSHRSTQRYKRKPFVSHYWDCRMKGRPAGTAKSDDPTKKTRRRRARARDLCDVKIRITEYLPAASQGQGCWTVQRVNGNGNNGKGDGVAGPHRHSLERSDEIKKNSVQRWLAQREKQAKEAQRTPLRRATGAALATVRKHSKDEHLKLYAACFCPFSQRVWIALEAKGLAYQYCEAEPRALVPTIRQGEWACADGAVILEYLEDMDARVPLYPSDARLKANCRVWIDHINSRIVPAFFALLDAQDPTQRDEPVGRLQRHISSLVVAADEHGPLFLGVSLSLVDLHLAPFALRLSRLLGPLRGWPASAPGSRWHRWLDALERQVHVAATMSLDDLYVQTVDLLVRPSAPAAAAPPPPSES